MKTATRIALADILECGIQTLLEGEIKSGSKKIADLSPGLQAVILELPIKTLSDALMYGAGDTFSSMAQMDLPISARNGESGHAAAAAAKPRAPRKRNGANGAAAKEPNGNGLSNAVDAADLNRVMPYLDAPVTIAQISAGTNLPKERLRPVLDELCRTGRVAKTGKARGTRYAAV